METSQIDIRWHELLFGVRWSVRYHMRRQQFFERWHTITSATSVVFGSATVAFVLAEMGAAWIAGGAIVVTFFSAIDLVVGTSRMARHHNDLARRFIGVEKSMAEVAEPHEEDVRRFTGERLTIESDEPPVLRNLDILCHNELMRAQGYPEDGQKQLGPVQTLFAPFLDWRPHAVGVSSGGTADGAE